jgi:hypothetical protein
MRIGKIIALIPVLGLLTSAKSTWERISHSSISSYSPEAELTESSSSHPLDCNRFPPFDRGKSQAHTLSIRFYFYFRFCFDRQCSFGPTTERLIITSTMMRSNWEIAPDFSDLLNLAREIREIVDPKAILFYIPGWQGAYDSNHPTYKPHPELGG